MHIADDLFNLQELKTDMQTKVDKLKIEYRQKYPLKLTAGKKKFLYETLIAVVWGDCTHADNFKQ